MNIVELSKKVGAEKTLENTLEWLQDPDNEVYKRGNAVVILFNEVPAGASYTRTHVVSFYSSDKHLELLGALEKVRLDIINGE